LLGLILKQRFDETKDLRYLQKSKIHFLEAHAAFAAEEEEEGALCIMDYLDDIELLAPELNFINLK
jgi:hypothetical protein